MRRVDNLFKSEPIDLKSEETHLNHQMPFRFYITEEGPYNAAQLANVRAALEFAGEKVQNTYQFEREITVDVKFENMANYGGGARGNPLLLRLINGVVYPTSIAKQGFSEEEWNSWVEEAPHRSKRDIGITFCYMKLELWANRFCLIRYARVASWVRMVCNGL